MKIERRRWIPLIVWVVVVFALPNILSLSGSGPDLPSRFDKVIHFLEYMVLAALFHWGFVYQPKLNRLLAFCAVMFAGLAIGALDEFTQYFIPYRNCSIMDWFADVAGTLAGTSLATLRLVRTANRKEMI
ncbi:MAG TPA: VanZ family protein [Patescibacteria group bacterium]|nr:VanZ family protein [Patescibacteria group bacterium]